MISNYHASSVSGQFYDESTVGSSCSTTDSSGTVLSTGSTQDNRTASALPDARSGLLQLPTEMKMMVCNQLSHRDIAALSQTCKMLYTFIDETIQVYRVRFEHYLTPAYQENFREAANLLTPQEVETWIRQLSDDQQFITRCLSLRGSKLFPEFLFFNMMKLKIKCRYLKVKAIQDIGFKGGLLAVHGAFSPNGRHMLTTNSLSAIIRSLNDEGQLEIKTSIKHLCQFKPRFSSNSRHIVTVCYRSDTRNNRGYKDEIEIYHCSNDGEWMKAITIPYKYNCYYFPFTFFNKSKNISLISDDDRKTSTVYDFDNNGNWSLSPTGNQDSHVHQISHSPDGLHGATFYYRPDSDDTGFCFIEFSAISDHNSSWLKKDYFLCNYVHKMFFSPDSRHLVTEHRGKTKIYSINSNEQWEPKKSIRYNPNHYDRSIDGCNYYHPEFHRTTFSPNGHYLAVIIMYCHRVRIYGLNSDEQWCRITNIDHSDDVNMVSFSSDSHHVVTISDDHSARIYGLESNGCCALEKIIVHDSAVKCADFSPDGSHLVTGCDSGQIKIYGIHKNGKWLQKGIIRGKINKTKKKGVLSVKFSPCGFRILACGERGTATLYTLRDVQLKDSRS